MPNFEAIEARHERENSESPEQVLEGLEEFQSACAAFITDRVVANPRFSKKAERSILQWYRELEGEIKMCRAEIRGRQVLRNPPEGK